MSQQARIDNFNNWPHAIPFKSELAFQKRLDGMEGRPFFIPFQLPLISSQVSHIVVSHLIDALDCLPNRPDHAFDWTWRGFEHLAKFHAGNTKDITKILRIISAPSLNNYLAANQVVSDSIDSFANLVPLQTCEYLLKIIATNKPYVFTQGQHSSLSGFAKRMLFSQGNPPVVSQELQTILEQLSAYDYQNTVSRRNGASLLRKVIQGRTLTINGVTLTLTQADRIFLLLSGLLYTFRNERVHGKSISPFKSSMSSVKTYAHCWFAFLLAYFFVIIYFHSQDSPEIVPGCPSININLNSNAFKSLFASYLNA